MADYDYSYDYGGGTPYDDWSGGGEMYAGGSPTFNEGSGWEQAGAIDPNWYENTGQYIGGSDPSGGGMPSWLSSILGAVGPLASRFGGPAASVIGSLTNAGRGSQAAQTAGQQQSQALNRGIDLQTAQWLQQQQNLAPYLQAGQGGLAQLQQLAGREQPGLPGAPAALSAGAYGMPQTTPGWTPQAYQGPQGPNAGNYRWTPGQGPQAQDYRYTPGNIPQAANYRYTPGAVPTLSGTELLANDPGYQFRMDEARKALEGSAAARGDLLSGQNLKALQSRSQDLASQEYGQAWNRASQQAQLREGWAQQASQMGWGQAEAESRLREQVNQIASQQGWSQAQAEAAFREQMGQLASQQGWNQALAGQQNQFAQGLQSQQWNQEQQKQYHDAMYNRMLEQAKYRYGADVAQQGTDYDRAQAQYRQQMAQYLLPWEQQSTLANIGGRATGIAGEQGQGAANAISLLLGRLGEAQGTSTIGSALAQNQGTTTTANSLASVLSRLNA